MTPHQFYERIFSACDQGVVECRAYPSGRRTWTTLGAWSTLDPFITTEVRRRENIGIGIATRVDDTAGTGDNLQQLGALYVDHDEPPRTALTRYENFAIPPSLITSSGGGVHCFWLLREALDLRTTNDFMLASSLLRRLAGYFGGDLQAAEAARCLRPVNTINYKYDVPQKVVVLQDRPTVINVNELAELLPNEVAVRNELVLESMIPVHHRNSMLYQLGRAMRYRHFPATAIFTVLEHMNRTVCAEPLDQAELSIIVRHVVTQPDRPTLRRRFIPAVGLDLRPLINKGARMDARSFLTQKQTAFVKKADLRRSGAAVYTIQEIDTVESRFSRPDEPPISQLCLVFTNKQKWTANQTNLQLLIQLLGHNTDRWINRQVELFVDMSVPNPSGGEAGGIRVRRPGTGPALEDDFEEPPYEHTTVNPSAKVS